MFTKYRLWSVLKPLLINREILIVFVLCVKQKYTFSILAFFSVLLEIIYKSEIQGNNGVNVPEMLRSADTRLLV